MGKSSVDSFARLYVVPGVAHCGGGEGFPNIHSHLRCKRRSEAKNATAAQNFLAGMQGDAARLFRASDCSLATLRGNRRAAIDVRVCHLFLFDDEPESAEVFGGVMDDVRPLHGSACRRHDRIGTVACHFPDAPSQGDHPPYRMGAEPTLVPQAPGRTRCRAIAAAVDLSRF